MTKSWDEIRLPKSGSEYGRRRVEASRAIPLNWARDINGKLLFIIELQGDHYRQYAKERISIAGLETRLEKGGKENWQRLVLELGEKLDCDLFEAFCKSVIAALENQADPAKALAIFFYLLRRWRFFLAANEAGLLSGRKLRGLFAELVFLSKLVAATGDTWLALTAWTGPEGAPQDFNFYDRAIEIKSLPETGASAVMISSENQLEAPGRKLYLGCYSLFESGEDGLSLNDMARKLNERFASSREQAIFMEKLAKAGYWEREEYSFPLLKAGEARFFRVDDSFPRIVRSGLPEAVEKVQYTLKLSSLGQWKCREAEALARALFVNYSISALKSSLPPGVASLRIILP